VANQEFDDAISIVVAYLPWKLHNVVPPSSSVKFEMLVASSWRLWLICQNCNCFTICGTCCSLDCGMT